MAQRPLWVLNRFGGQYQRAACSVGKPWGRQPISGKLRRKFGVSRVTRRHLIRGDEKGAGYGEVSSAWANRVQPANSKGGNWWQSPLCGAHTDRHFRESPCQSRVCGVSLPISP